MANVTADMVLSDLKSNESFGGSLTTTSSNYISTGVGVMIVPRTAKVLVSGQFYGSSDTAGGQVGVSIWRSLTGIPPAGNTINANDVAIGWGALDLISSATNQPIIFTQNAIDDITAGTTFYYYVVFSATTPGSTAKTTAVNINAQSI